MAAMRSLGIHVPAALPYLIEEGILPLECQPEQYQWDTFTSCEGPDAVEEEVVATKHAVAWTQGNTVRNIYRFELEGEDVRQALLTTFSARPRDQEAASTLDHRNHRFSLGGLGLSGAKQANPGTSQSTERKLVQSRALVVLLRTKLHIYILQGSSHIVDLPFEVECLFPAPRGLILQRKRTPRHTRPPTPQVPSAPPNSFFSSQLLASLSATQNSQASKNSMVPSPASIAPQTDILFQNLISSPFKSQDDDVANLYSLSDPLSDLGVLTYSVQYQRPRFVARKLDGIAVEFESLDPAEQIVYVSTSNEIKRLRDDTIALILLVTFNDELDILTIWHAWYMDNKPLHELLKQRAERKAAKARRRSSFMSTNFVPGTGSVTPAARNRDSIREPIMAGTTRQPHEPQASQVSAVSSQKTIRQQEEDAMASQMDPDHQPSLSQQTIRESRRISSMNAELRSNANTVSASFGGMIGRRAASYGGQHERRSLGHRRSRGSTPGSILSRSIGPDDDQMDLDSNTTDYDHEETVDGILQHMRQTFDVSILDNVIGNTDQGFKKEFTVRKIHSFPAATPVISPVNPCRSRFKVFTFANPRTPGNAHDERIKIFVQDYSLREVQRIELQIRQRSLWPETEDSPLVDIPLLVSDNTATRCDDMIKIQDKQTTAALFSNQGLLFSVDDSLCQMPVRAAYRVYSQSAQESTRYQSDKDIGKNRILTTPAQPLLLRQAGLQGTYDEVDTQGVHHRRRLQLSPDSPEVEELLQLCEIFPPASFASAVRRTWCEMYARLHEASLDISTTASSPSFVALVAAIFLSVIELLDDKARAALKISKLAMGKKKPPSSTKNSLRKHRHHQKLRRGSAWNWIPNSEPPSRLLYSPSGVDKRKDQLLVIAASLADEAASAKPKRQGSREKQDDPAELAIYLMLSLYLCREEQKLCLLSRHRTNLDLAPVIAQLAQWVLGSESDWSPQHGSLASLEGASDEIWAYVRTSQPGRLVVPEQFVGILEWFESSLKNGGGQAYPDLITVMSLHDSTSGLLADLTFQGVVSRLTPRSKAISNIMVTTEGLKSSPANIVEQMAKEGLTTDVLDTLPQAIAAPFKEAISRCEKEPPTHWSENLLRLVGRSDLLDYSKESALVSNRTFATNLTVSHDLQLICHALEQQAVNVKTKEANRHAVSQLIFSEDRRLVEAVSLMHFHSVQIAECPKQPEWDDAQHFEYQRRMMPWVTCRMIALPAGEGMIHFHCQVPLLTEKFSLPGFNSSCLMMPMGQTLTTDRAGLTEEKVNWAYFHAGVSAGLRISHTAKGIDTSWIAFNKPTELTNRHAGFLLALGISGHLRHVAKWLSFKYLTPKHTMTSVGLLLGLSASYIGTMDGLITRMLSVHITRMLPPGAAELNVSPVTQTAGLMGIGLLYYNTQHRRMSEIMLGEIENLDVEDPDSGPDPLRDESYRLAAGFALGFINLAMGQDVRGLQGMQISERLLVMAVGPKPVNAVHMFDIAAPGAVIAVALIFMKSGDKAIARKIDIPDTEAQFDQVRPDVLQLRTMAKHIILWDDIQAQGTCSQSPSWIMSKLPASFKNRLGQIRAQLAAKRVVDSAHVPLFNIVTGLAWALALKYAGSGDQAARDEILDILSQFHQFSERADAYYYDGKVGRASLRRCIDMLGVCAATIMAGTGDLETFRFLRRLHGRVEQEITYGSHLAAHMAIGLLFLGGGTYTLGTSDLAVASLICALYPLFPTDVHDNAVHLQAFRHFWVFAAEARCIVVEDVHTGRPVHMPLRVTMNDGSVKELRAPCLLPELHTIATVQTMDPTFWQVTLDFRTNSPHLTSFRQSQRVFVRHSPAMEAYSSGFSAALAALNDSQQTPLSSTYQQQQQMWQSIFSLPALAHLDRAEMDLVLAPEISSSVYLDERGTVIDDRLSLAKSVAGLTLTRLGFDHSRLQRPPGFDRSFLWNLRLLFSWAEKARREGDGKLRWLGLNLIEELRTRVREWEMELSGL